ncbi:MAG: hypothetical protein ACRDHZ_15730, partial [Ktedonobacteraceae bacterium]
MQTISCPLCGELLSETAGYCRRCGKVALLAETTSRFSPKRAHPLWQATQRALPTENEQLLSEADEADITIKLPPKAKTGATLDQEAVDDLEEDELPEQYATWQKVVTTTPHTLPTCSPQKLAHKKSGRFFLPKPHIAPRSFLWLSLVGLFALILSSLSVVVMSFGHATPAVVLPQPALHVSPSTIALGGIITLRGANFTPDSTLTLSRDQHLLLVDTGGESRIQTDQHGDFSDTVIIDPNWLAGSHTLSATGADAHQRATFSLTVTGQSALQGPPHLLLSANSLD